MPLTKSSAFSNVLPTHTAPSCVGNPFRISSSGDRTLKNIKTFNSSVSKGFLYSGVDDETAELTRISVKKEVERRNKLKKLFERYLNIEIQEKKHVKMIKAAIIEMKDATAACKLKLLFDPSVLVENSIRVETREFLCALLNTFYKSYENNEKSYQSISKINNSMAFLIKGISFNEDQILNMQKNQINEQTQLEGELYLEKNKLKEEGNKKKSVQEIHESVKKCYLEAKQKHENKKNVVSELEESLKSLNEQLVSMKKNIEYQTNMKNECQSEIDKEILYQQKLNDEFISIQSEVENSEKQEKKMLREIICNLENYEQLEETVAAKIQRDRLSKIKVYYVKDKGKEESLILKDNLTNEESDNTFEIFILI